MRKPRWMVWRVAAAGVMAALVLAACAPGAAQTVEPPVTLVVATAPEGSAATPTGAAPTAAATETPAPTTTPVLAAMEREEWSQSSPDGQWVATGLAALPTKGGHEYYTRLQVARVDGTQTWTPVDTWGPTGLGYTIPAPLHWSRDGQAFYFTNRPHPDGCALLVNGSDLLRLDLATGAVSRLLPDMGLSLALSPDEARVAYLGYGERGLIVHDLATGEELALPVESGQMVGGAAQDQAGLPVWAPSGERLALTVAHDPCGDPSLRSHSILVVDIASGAAAPLVERDARQFVTVGWPAEDRLQLEDSNGARWTINPGTGELESAAH